MFGIGMWELAVIFVVALLIYGPKRLPEIARTLGKGMAEFRRASNELRHSFMLEVDPPAQRPAGAGAKPPSEPERRPDQLVDAEAPAAEARAAAAHVAPEAAVPASEPAAPHPDGGATPTDGR